MKYRLMALLVAMALMICGCAPVVEQVQEDSRFVHAIYVVGQTATISTAGDTLDLSGIYTEQPYVMPWENNIGTLISVPEGATFTVKQQDARGKDMDDWQFEVTDDAGNLGIPRIIANGKALTTEPEADSETDIISWINKATSTYNFPMTRKDIKQKVFAEIGGQKNHKLQQQDLTIAINRGYLIETAMKQNGYPMLDVAGDLPF